MSVIVTITHDDLVTYLEEGEEASIVSTVKADHRRVRWVGDIRTMQALLGVLARNIEIDVAIDEDRILATIIEPEQEVPLPPDFEDQMEALIAEAEMLTLTADRAVDEEIQDEGAQRLLRAIFENPEPDDRNNWNEGEPS